MSAHVSAPSSPPARPLLLQLWPVCRFGIHVCNMGIPLLSPLLCQVSLVFCQITQFNSVLALAMPEHGSVNVYDVRKQVRSPPALNE